mmetsp:Transcript_10582/g.16739  ORF Transcript_10582/g.16739 Transcript_10582/m.16739 type:complete len:245 (-) Transcript_10582:107-841(-)
MTSHSTGKRKREVIEDRTTKLPKFVRDSAKDAGYKGRLGAGCYNEISDLYKRFVKRLVQQAALVSLEETKKWKRCDVTHQCHKPRGHTGICDLTDFGLRKEIDRQFAQRSIYHPQRDTSITLALRHIVTANSTLGFSRLIQSAETKPLQDIAQDIAQDVESLAKDIAKDIARNIQDIAKDIKGIAKDMPVAVPVPVNVTIPSVTTAQSEPSESQPAPRSATHPSIAYIDPGLGASRHSQGGSNK